MLVARDCWKSGTKSILVAGRSPAVCIENTNLSANNCQLTLGSEIWKKCDANQNRKFFAFARHQISKGAPFTLKVNGCRQVCIFHINYR